MSADDFKKQVLMWAVKVGVKPKEIHIRLMTKKLASCSSKGRLSFAPEVLNAPFNKQNYVIIHELLHLKYPNHSRMFKLLLKYYFKQVDKI